MFAALAVSDSEREDTPQVLSDSEHVVSHSQMLRIRELMGKDKPDFVPPRMRRFAPKLLNVQVSLTNNYDETGNQQLSIEINKGSRFEELIFKISMATGLRSDYLRIYTTKEYMEKNCPVNSMKLRVWSELPVFADYDPDRPLIDLFLSDDEEDHEEDHEEVHDDEEDLFLSDEDGHAEGYEFTVMVQFTNVFDQTGPQQVFIKATNETTFSDIKRAVAKETGLNYRFVQLFTNKCHLEAEKPIYSSKPVIRARKVIAKYEEYKKDCFLDD
jgi:hypothetical protein